MKLEQKIEELEKNISYYMSIIVDYHGQSRSQILKKIIQTSRILEKIKTENNRARAHALANKGFTF